MPRFVLDIQPKRTETVNSLPPLTPFLLHIRNSINIITAFLINERGDKVSLPSFKLHPSRSLPRVHHLITCTPTPPSPLKGSEKQHN